MSKSKNEPKPENTKKSDTSTKLNTEQASESTADNIPAAADSPDYEALYNECKGAVAELEDCKDKYLRLLAEYDNYRKRSQKDKDSMFEDIRAATISELLPVYDNLERALLQHTEDEAYYKGVEMTMNQFKQILASMNVESFGEPGDTFDPNMHSGVMHVEDENFGENEVAEVFQKGFRIGDKIIRFAMVKVAN